MKMRETYNALSMSGRTQSSDRDKGHRGHQVPARPSLSPQTTQRRCMMSARSCASTLLQQSPMHACLRSRFKNAHASRFSHRGLYRVRVKTGGVPR
jgi:hypothetical protein